MKRMFSITLFVFYFSLSNFLYAQNECIKFIQKVRLSEKVLIVGIGDAIISILSKKGIVVVDAGQSSTLTRHYKRIIEQEFENKNFAYLINTHSHHDHTGGNRIFSDLKIISHSNCTAEISDYWKNYERIKNGYQKLIDQFDIKLNSPEIDSNDRKEVLIDRCRYTMVLSDIKANESITLPNTTFSDTMNINMGDITLNLIYFGKAHTNSDILVHIPEEKLLLVGDLFVKGGNLSFKIQDQEDAKYCSSVLSSLIKKNNINTVITGHGDILTKDDLYSFYESIINKLKSFK